MQIKTITIGYLVSFSGTYGNTRAEATAVLDDGDGPEALAAAEAVLRLTVTQMLTRNLEAVGQHHEVLRPWQTPTLTADDAPLWDNDPDDDADDRPDEDDRPDYDAGF